MGRKGSQRLPSYFLRITKRLIKVIDFRPSSHQAVRKVLVRLKYSVPLSKAESGFAIVTEECLTFRTVSPSRQTIRSGLLLVVQAIKH